MPIQFTRKGRYEVWRDGQKISEHNQEREATEQIINHSSVYGDGDYEIKGYLVVARVVGSVNPQTGDTTPPTTPGSVSASATSATTGTVTWTASTDASGVAGYQIFLDGAPLSPTTTNLSYSLTGLSPSTQYAVTVVAFDAAGNNSVAGGPALFTTDANSAPVWALGNQAYETGASVSISLDTVCTDADGDTITYSLVSGSLPSGLALSGARNETLSGTVTTVETANFTLGASDGIASVQTVALTFTISEPDTTAPAAPTGLAISGVSSTGLILNWDDNAESDLNHYTLYRSLDNITFGIRADNLTTSAYTETGLNASTTYYYYVTATDDSDNESSASSTVSDTTLVLNTPYDLYATDSQSRGTIPFTVTWPTAPNITSEATVSTAAALESSLAVNGRRTIVSAGTYSADIALNGTDQELVLGAGVTINPTSGSGNFTINGDRIKISGNGGRINMGLYSTGAADVLIDNLEVYTQEGASAFSDTVEISGARRLAIINSDFYAWRYAGLIWDYQDIVLANSRFRSFGSSGGSQATMRFAVDGTAGTYPDTRVTIVDCWFGNTSHHALRIHGHADRFWLRNITSSNGNGVWINPEHTGANSYNVTNVWLYDSSIYESTIALANYARLQTFTLDELSTYYSGYGGVSSQGDWSIGTENISATQTAPAWSKL